MFNIGFLELIVVLLVAFLIVGPKDLPKVARWIARQIKSLRRIIREVKKETGWDEFSKELKAAGDEVKSAVKNADVSGELRDAKKSVEQSMDEVKKDVQAAAEEIKKA